MEYKKEPFTIKQGREIVASTGKEEQSLQEINEEIKAIRKISLLLRGRNL